MGYRGTGMHKKERERDRERGRGEKDGHVWCVVWLFLLQIININ